MHKRLGEILVQAGVIDDEQLKLALAEAALWGHRVGEVLVSRGDCEEAQILEALATQLGVEVAPLATTVMIPRRILDLVSADFARERQLLPLFLDADAGVLEVAMADPADQESLDELRFRTGHTIRPQVAMASEVEEALERFYGPPPSAPAATTPPGGGAPLRQGLQVRVGHEGASAPPAEAPPPAASEAGEGDLHAEVDRLRGQLARVYEILREASVAHQVMLSMLADRGLLNREQYGRRLQEHLERLRR
ncbi:MAG: hypothetical protein H6704_05935 [Myxococcales bacterium]|nr:hypothetical protein [Myxococcales bacterium]